MMSQKLKILEKGEIFMGKLGKLSESDKRFCAFMGAITAGVVAFVTAAGVGCAAYMAYCQASEEREHFAS